MHNRPLAVTAVENALVDLLVRADDDDLRELGMTKGVMQLVDVATQARILGNLGKLTTEVELGGSAANVLRGLGTLGKKCSYSACVGQDDYGQKFTARLEQLGILNRLGVVPHEATGTCLVVVTPDGERTLNTHLGACRTYAEHFLPLGDIAASQIFFTTGYVWDTPSQIEAITKALGHARSQGTLVAFDFADPFVVHRSGSQLEPLLRQGMFDIVFANAEEAQALLGCRGAAAAQQLAALVPLAVVKDGAQGAYVGYQGGKVLHVPAHAATVVRDTTGAGDLFAAGFLYGISSGLSLQKSASIGAFLASDTISHLGVRLSSHVGQQVQSLVAAG